MKIMDVIRCPDCCLPVPSDDTDGTSVYSCPCGKIWELCNECRHLFDQDASSYCPQCAALDSLKIPTKATFVKAAVRAGTAAKDAEQMYDLLVAEDTVFDKAMHEWAVSMGLVSDATRIKIGGSNG